GNNETMRAEQGGAQLFMEFKRTDGFGVGAEFTLHDRRGDHRGEEAGPGPCDPDLPYGMTGNRTTHLRNGHVAPQHPLERRRLLLDTRHHFRRHARVSVRRSGVRRSSSCSSNSAAAPMTPAALPPYPKGMARSASPLLGSACRRTASRTQSVAAAALVNMPPASAIAGGFR